MLSSLYYNEKQHYRMVPTSRYMYMKGNAYSPNCIMMLPAYAHRVTTDESKEKNSCLVAWVGEGYDTAYIGI